MCAAHDSVRLGLPLQATTVVVAGRSWSRSLCVWRWRGTALLLRLAGLDCCSGWPPTPSALWTAYATAFCLILTLLKLGVFYFVLSAPNEISGVNKVGTVLFTVNVLIKNSAVAIVQVVMIVLRAHQGLLSRALLQYLAACPPSEHSWRGILATDTVNLATLMLPFVASLFVAPRILREGLFATAMYYGLGVLPATALCMVGDSFFAVMVAVVFGTAEVAEAVQDEADRLMRLSGPRRQQRRTADGVLDPVGGCGDKLRPLDSAAVAKAVRRDKDLGVREARAAAGAAGALRALRVRQQLIHDMVLFSNSAYAWPSLCWLVTIVFDITFNVFLALAIYRGTRDMSVESTITWVVTLSARFCLICVLGQRPWNHSRRICTILEGLLTDNPDVPAGVKVEVVGFVRQVQMQDNRFGLFTFLYYDMNTMSAVLSSILTYLIVIIQFEYGASP